MKMPAPWLCVLLFLYFVLGGLGKNLAAVSLQLQNTPVYGQSIRPPTYIATAQPFDEKIEKINFQFGMYGLQRVTVCVRPFVSIGDGGVWDLSNTSSVCTTGGCSTCEGEESANKFTPDEWSVGVSLCRGNGFIQWIKMDTNLGNYWEAGNYTKCEVPPSNYPTTGPITGIQASNDQVNSEFSTIGSIAFTYFTCIGTDCPTNGYNGGGECAIKNGGCDVHTSCDNSEGCSECPDGFSGTGDTICVKDGVVDPVPIYTFGNYSIFGAATDSILGHEFSATPNTYKISRIRTYYSNFYGVFTQIEICFRNIIDGEYEGTQECSALGERRNPDNVDLTLQLDEDEWVTSVESCNDIFFSVTWMQFELNDGSIYETGDDLGCFFYNSAAIITANSALVGITAYNRSYFGGFDYLCGVGLVIANCTSDCPLDFFDEPISACFTFNGGCGDNAVCWDNGTVICVCFPGYERNSTGICVVSDLCAANPCANGTACTQVRPNFYTCGPCPSGFVGSGYTQCQDINECNSANDCNVNATCINVPGNYSCKCNEGFIGDGFTCNDANKCTLVCGPNANCTSILGGFACACDDGYTGDGFNCTDINECVGQHNCSTVANCTNTLGSFSCKCSKGYEGDGFNCTDIDECANGDNRCNVNATCTNTVGSYHCMCKKGFTGNGTVCLDLDECQGRANCSAIGGVCINLFGSFKCECAQGYKGDGYNCSDINECLNTSSCDPNANCTNKIGNYSCLCKEGFTGNGYTCSDIDECATRKQNNCSATGATCTNIPGSFTCECNPGFLGDGYTCKDINECSENPCIPPLFCNNTMGAYSCDCPHGYTKVDNSACQDINECLVDNGGCDFRVTCTNNAGGFMCGRCPVGYYGPGNGTNSCFSLCGDGICDFRFEDCVTCPRDCPSPTCNVCGDRSCNASNGETCSSCFVDCGPCLTTCDPTCGEHGKCVQGFCVCKGNWTGPTCSTAQSYPLAALANTTLASVYVTAQTAANMPLHFTISLSSIVELDENSTVVAGLPATSIDFSLASMGRSSDRVFNFSAVLPNKATLRVVVYYFENETTVAFAGTNTTYPANTLKLRVNVQKWPFKATKNSLGIVLNSPFSDNSATEQVACVNHQEDESGNLRWFMININGAALYGQFLDKAVVDGRVRTVTYQLNSDTTITAILPHFWDYADMDPDFSVLLGDSNASCEKKKNITKKVLTIVVPVVLVLGLIICIVVVGYPRVKLWINVRMGRGPPVQVSVLTEMSEIPSASASTSIAPSVG